MKHLLSSLYLALTCAALPSHAFILIDPSYRLANPERTMVNIASGGCTGNGISNEELTSMIKTSLERYWNTVTESRLRMHFGQTVSTTLSSDASAGEILVGCQPLASAAGTTYPNNGLNGAKIIMNASAFPGGSYSQEYFIGVLTHELGHAIGLHHSNDPASVMTYESHDWGPAAGYLSQDDKDGVIYLYPNESQLGGFLGACSAIAGNQKVPTNPWSYVAELLSIVLIGQALYRINIFWRRRQN